MGLKLLHSADWHMDSPFASFTREQRHSLRTAQQKLPRQIARLARQEECDLVLLAGDLFDGAYTQYTLDEVRRALSDCNVPVLIAPGNHDFLAEGSPWTEVQWPSNVHIFDENVRFLDIPELDCRVYGAGYRSMDCPGLLQGFHADRVRKYQIGLFHGDPNNAKSDYCPVTAEQVSASGLDYLALGHVHSSGGFQAGRTLCAWPGTPMGRGWDETGEKGVFLVTLGDESPEITSVTLDTLRFMDVSADVEKDGSVETVLPSAQTENFYRLTLTGSGEINLQQLRSRYCHIPNLVIRDRTHMPSDIWAGAGEDSLRGLFLDTLREMGRENSEQEQLANLAAEMAQRILEGREVELT